MTSCLKQGKAETGMKEKEKNSEGNDRKTWQGHEVAWMDG